VSINLASRALGASVLAANDESFGEKENLLVDAAANFVPGSYGHKGEIVDGWETRRRGEPGEDWAIVRLGSPGVISEVDVDTSFFTGNFPERCRIDACGLEGYPSVDELTTAEWDTIVDWTPLEGDTHNLLPVLSTIRYTHIRLVISTDGGVARLRVYGEPCLDPAEVDGVTVDLAGRFYGGEVVDSSDNFYSTSTALNHPHLAHHMGEGWETARRRGPGHDFAVFRLGAPARVAMVEVDTSYYKCNASKSFALSVATGGKAPDADSGEWTEVIARSPLQPDTRQRFRTPQVPAGVTHVRLDVFPDGGVSRLRVLGAVDGAARAELGRDWFNALPSPQARRVLQERCGLSTEQSGEIVDRRPLSANDVEYAAEPVRNLLHGAEAG
jgi:allantoicase